MNEVTALRLLETNSSKYLRKEVIHMNPFARVIVEEIKIKQLSPKVYDIMFKFNKKFQSNQHTQVEFWEECNFRYFDNNFLEPIR